jgi:hypothetical protein
VSKKKSSIEDLIQKYLNAKEGSAEKKMLLGLIKLKKPNFKEPK